jgi:phosphate/sulfate permease
MLLSLAYGGNVFRSALGTYAAMLNIYMTAAVADTIPVPIWMRCIAAVFTASGAIVGGARLMPVTGETCSAGTSQVVNQPCLLSLVSTRVMDRASKWIQMAASMVLPSKAGVDRTKCVMLMAYVFSSDSCLAKWCCWCIECQGVI